MLHRFTITLDDTAATALATARDEVIVRNPDMPSPSPSDVVRYVLRAHAGRAAQVRDGGGSGRVEPAPSSPAPVEPQVQVQVPPPPAPPVEPQVQVPPPRPEEPALAPPPVRATPPARSMRVDRGAKARKAKRPAKASTGAAVERTPPASGKKRGASADDIARIAEYLHSAGALSPKALADRAGVPGAKTSLHDIKKRDPRAGLSTINTERILAFIAEQPRAQSAATVARASQGETPREE